VRLAKKFETLVQSDRRFEVPAKRHLGMVVFRLKVIVYSDLFCISVVSVFATGIVSE